jgi:pSer/pThr/pTyr-binding forkhead associated (FHA) protein
MRINGREIDHRYDLKDGDIVEIGGIKLQFYFKE